MNELISPESRSVSLLNSISNEKKIEILRKNWTSHDARWEMGVVREFGWEKGNKLNKEIIGEMGKVMMYRLVNALNFPKVKNIDDLILICSTTVEFYYPPPNMSYEFEKISENEALAIVKKCPIIEQVKKIGVTEFYECACLSMRAGWYKALGLKVKEELLTCIKNDEEVCNIKLSTKGWSK